MQKILIFILFPALLTLWETNQLTSYNLEGKVIDHSTGSPLFGVMIQVKGKRKSVLTDINGAFSIQMAKKCEVIVFSYKGYEAQELNLCSGKKNIVKMVMGQEPNEVVVTATGVKRESKALGYSRTKIKSKDLKPRKKVQDNALYDPETYEEKPTFDALSGRTTGEIIEHNNRRSPIRDSLVNDEIDWNTEDYDQIIENRFLSPLNAPLSTFSIDVDAAAYANMRRFIRADNQPPKDAIRIEELVNYFDYDYAEPKGAHPFEIDTELSTCPWQPNHHLLHIGLQGETIDNDQLPASNLVFLLDVSGSMNEPNKLPLLKSSLKLLVDQLRSKDKVSIVVYAGAAGVVLPATSGSDKNKIKESIEMLQSGGSTAGGAGIQLAYKIARKHFIQDGNNRVILATDGDFNVGFSSDADLVRLIEEERQSGVFLTVLGFGTGNYKDNKMQQLADKGNGNHAYIDNLTEARKVLVNEFGATVFTIAKDVKIQIEFNPANVNGYRLIGYENRLLAAEDFNDDQKDAGELGAGHTVTALYEVIPAGQASEFISYPDSLKYQKNSTVGSSSNLSDLATIKFRYKKPDGEISRLMTHVIPNTITDFQKSSSNFKWSTAVAEFGLLLIDSKYKGQSNFDKIIDRARSEKGKDPNGYRAEFISLVQKVKNMDKKIVAEKR